MVIRSHRDFAAGLMFVAVGGGFALEAWSYRMGTPARMGPGYFPVCLGLLLAALGGVVLAGALAPGADDDRIAAADARSVLWVLGSVALFGVLLHPLGLVGALAALVVAASLASREFTWTATLLNALVLLAVGAGGLVVGLGLAIPLWPTALAG